MLIRGINNPLEGGDTRFVISVFDKSPKEDSPLVKDEEGRKEGWQRSRERHDSLVASLRRKGSTYQDDS